MHRYAGFVAAGVLVGTVASGVAGAAESPSPFEGRVHALAVDPATNALFVGAGPVYRSDDDGRTWAKVDGMPKAAGSMSVAAIAIDPRNPKVLYASGPGLAVVKSEDGGKIWTRIAAGLSSDSTEAFAIDAQDSSKLYVWVRGAGLFRSKDAGASWQKVDGGPRGLNIRSLVSLNEPTGMGGLWLYAGIDVGVVKSPDCFCGWDRLANQGLPPNQRVSSLAVDPEKPSVIYAGLVEGVFKTEDAGKTWTKLAADVTDAVVAVHPKNPRHLYAAGRDGGLFASRDGGGTWQRVR
jgi:photosystem II stability/assembly factor-like uncharacterized protein